MSNNEIIIKPVLQNDIKAEIKGIAKVEDNINEAKEWALNLREYYSNLIFTDDQIQEAKGERAEINKTIKKMADYRKNIVSEFKKPIEIFESTAKEAEKILSETADFVDVQVKNFENKKKEEKREQILEIFNTNNAIEELKIEKIFDERWLNVTYKIEDIELEILGLIDRTVNDLKIIEDLKSDFEITLKDLYLKTFDLSKVMQEKTRLEEFKKRQEESKQEKQPVLTVIKGSEQPIMAVEKDAFDEILEQQKRVVRIKINATEKQLLELKNYLDTSKIFYESEEL